MQSFTNHRRLRQAFCGHSARSNLAASIYMSLESRTSHSKGAPESIRFHRDRHSVVTCCYYWHCCRPPTENRHPMRSELQHAFANTVDTLGNPVRAALSYWWWWSLYSRRHWDRKFQRPTCSPNAATTDNRRPNSGIELASNA